MQSFHQSRGRILFEVFCSLAISASCAGAWMQTGASALLPAASVAALFGLVHAFDMRRARFVSPASQSIELPRVEETLVPVSEASLIPPVAAEQQLPSDSSKEKAEPAAPRPTRARRAKAAPKGARRRPAAREEEKVAALAPVEEVKVGQPAPSEEANVAEAGASGEAEVTETTPLDETQVTRLTPPEDAQATAPRRPEETSPVPLRPLFDPEPFLRQQRAAFGRKA
jgi:hypothetical protein